MGRTAWVLLDLAKLDVHGAHRTWQPEQLMPEWTYPLHGMAYPGAVRLVPTVGRGELIFPIAEMVRV